MKVERQKRAINIKLDASFIMAFILKKQTFIVFSSR